MGEVRGWNIFVERIPFAVTMASLFEVQLLRKALERKFPCLAASWDWDEPIMSAVEVISRPDADRFSPCPRNLVSSSVIGDHLLTSFWQEQGRRKLSNKAGADKL